MFKPKMGDSITLLKVPKRVGEMIAVSTDGVGLRLGQGDHGPQRMRGNQTHQQNCGQVWSWTSWHGN
jgi:hypothetical protein